jgi:hypothetical protein
VTLRDELRKRWFVASLSVAAAFFFAIALVFSAANYVSVMDAKQRVELTDAVEGVEVLENGSLKISLSVTLVNPSRQYITISSISWNVKVVNGSDTGVSYIPVLSQYGVSPEYSEVESRSEMEFVYAEVVSDPEKIARLQGFVDYSSSQGVDLTLETAPYLHDFRVVGWLGDYPHDYQYSREFYLNDMVRIDERYLGGEYL